MTLREEFNEAFEDKFVNEADEVPLNFPEKFALWAAKWMGERLAKEADKRTNPIFENMMTSTEIRQLTKSLGE